MSYHSAFCALVNSDAEPFTRGAYALLRFSNHQDLLERRIPNDHDAHVFANEDRLTSEAAARVLTNYCPPPVENEASQVVTTPGASGLVAGIPTVELSAAVSVMLTPSLNVDMHGRRVRKGSLVSWHGYRIAVSCVRKGVVYPDQYRLPHLLHGCTSFNCSSVQVVQ